MPRSLHIYLHEGSRQELPFVNAVEGTSCHDRAQLGLDHLQQPPHSALKRREYDSSHNLIAAYDTAAKGGLGRPPKRRQLLSNDLESGYGSDNLQYGPQQAEPEDDNLEQDELEQDEPEQDEPEKRKLERRAATVKKEAQALVKKASAGLKELGVKEFITALPLQLTDGCVEVNISEDQYSFQDSTVMWEWAQEFGITAQGTKWTVFLVSSCLRIVEKKLGKNVSALDESQELKRRRWATGVLTMNRIVNQMGIIGLRLYDVYASKSMSTGAWAVLNQNSEKDFIFHNCSTKAEEVRNAVADMTAKSLSTVEILISTDARVLFLPYLIWAILDSKLEEGEKLP